MQKDHSTKQQPNLQQRPARKLPTWVVAVLITVAVLIFFSVLYGLAAFILFKGLKQGGEYLNGAPITVSNEVIEARAQADTKWLRGGDYDSFDKNLDLTEVQRSYRSDIDALQQAGNCALTQTKIFKGQGGFDGGASITYNGTVSCGRTPAYDVELSYRGSALSKTDAADINRFSLFEAVVSTANKSRINDYVTRTGETINVNVVPEKSATERTFQQIDSRMYATIQEYEQAVTMGELKGCTPDGELLLQTSFRWQSKQTPSEVGQYLSPPVFRCK